MILKLQDFIISHKDNWEELLTTEPYFLKIKKDNGLVIFSYNQIKSDFSNPIVREARGVILEEKNWNIVAYAFNKFFNFGEVYADEIDWSSAVVSSKEDGSIMKVFYYDGAWRVATNNSIDAYNTPLESGKYSTFGQLFNVAARNSHLNYDRLDVRYTYIFELCSAFNQIVVPYEEPKLFHIGTRNNITGQEEEIDIGVEKPRVYKLASLEDCISLAKTFDFTQEGFVVKDKNYNRIKIKSEDYVKAHHLVNNNSINIERAIALIRTNETQEFLNYFPQYLDFIQDINNKIIKLKRILDWELGKAINNLYLNRKEFAEKAKKSKIPFIWFKIYDNNNFVVQSYLDSLSDKKITQLIEQLVEEDIK